MKKRPTYKTAKRLGAPVFEKTQTQKYAVWEQSKPFVRRGRGPRTDFAKQMLEKQKARFTYGISERQFRRYADKAMTKEKPSEALFDLLERRLDNIVYRIGLAPTRRAARQMVSHGHIIVGDKKTTIPSHSLSTGSTFSVRDGSKQKKHIAEKTESITSLPNWLSFSNDTLTGEISANPSLNDHELLFDLDAIIEFYNR